MPFERFQRILLVKLADIGDAVLALPALQALRSAYPAATIDVISTPQGAAVFHLSPVINTVYSFDKAQFDQARELLAPQNWLPLLRLAQRLRRKRYDAVVLLHHLTTPFGRWKHRMLLAATGAPVRAGLDNGTGTFLTHRIPDLGFGAKPEWQYGLEVVQALGATAQASAPHLQLPSSAKAEARNLLQGSHGPTVVVHASVGPYGPGRAWPLAHVHTVIQGLLDAGYTVILTGTAADGPSLQPLRHLPGVRDLVGQTTLPVLAAVLQHAHLVIGADNGVLHLASAVGTPVLALFGPSNVYAWAPFHARILRAGEPLPPGCTSIALTLGLPCSPCFYVGYRLGRPQGCHTRSCLYGLSPALVLRYAFALLDRTQK
ncbi:MAG: glycosyltransferase family 9 protein [Thermorudis peleae]|nr:glycosyltransferase family 9 protein [Thermorudis peleae]